MLRHLRSLRLMRRDGGASNLALSPLVPLVETDLGTLAGWINGLLQEAENERSTSHFSLLAAQGPHTDARPSRSGTPPARTSSRPRAAELTILLLLQHLLTFLKVRSSSHSHSLLVQD